MKRTVPAPMLPVGEWDREGGAYVGRGVLVVNLRRGSGLTRPVFDALREVLESGDALCRDVGEMCVLRDARGKLSIHDPGVALRVESATTAIILRSREARRVVAPRYAAILEALRQVGAAATALGQDRASSPALSAFRQSLGVLRELVADAASERETGAPTRAGGAGQGELLQRSTATPTPPAIVSASPPTPEKTGNSWVREGGVWHLTFDGKTVSLRHLRGLADIAALLSKPDQDVRAEDLLGRAEHPSLGGMPVLTAEAIEKIGERLEELRELPPTDENTSEIQRLNQEVLAAHDKKGRVREIGGEGEQARKTVGKRVRFALKRILAAHEVLGEHLSNAISLSFTCRYDMNGQSVRWILSPGQTTGP